MDASIIKINEIKSPLCNSMWIKLWTTNENRLRVEVSFNVYVCNLSIFRLFSHYHFGFAQLFNCLVCIESLDEILNNCQIWKHFFWIRVHFYQKNCARWNFSLNSIATLHLKLHRTHWLLFTFASFAFFCASWLMCLHLIPFDQSR